MTNGARRVPGGRRCAQSPCFLFGAKEARADEEYRGIRQRLPYWCNKTKTRRTARRRSSWSPRRHHPMAFHRRRPLLLRYLVLDVSLQICLPLLAPFPLDIWEEEQGLYK